MAINRWGLNKKESVGPVSSWIRECSPKTEEEWKEFYYQKLSEFLKNKNITLSPEEYLRELGLKLYTKITEVIRAEIDEITEIDCINYVYNLVIRRTFDGYQTERKMVYEVIKEKLSKIHGLDIEIKPAPDEWDRLYNVDFYIQAGNNYIGLQIKPISFEHAPEYQVKWAEIYKESHKKFEKDKGGKVFIIFSIKEGNTKKIYNEEVIDEIFREFKRLKKE